MRKSLYYGLFYINLLALYILFSPSAYAASDTNNDDNPNQGGSTPVFLPLITTNSDALDESENSNRAAPQACTVCQVVFRDRFPQRGIDSSWTWTDPVNDVTRSTTARPGYLRFYTESPNGNNLAPGLMGAPRLLRPLNATNFKITTRVEITPIHDYQGAGLLIWQDNDNFIRLERGLGLNGQGVYFAKSDASGFTYQFAATETTNLQLRLQRIGRAVIAWMKVDQNGWQVVGAVNALPSSDLQVGLDMVADFWAPPTTADFDNFVITTCVNDSAEGEDEQ